MTFSRLRESDGGRIRGKRKEYYYDQSDTITVVAGRRSLKTQIAKRKCALWLQPDANYKYDLPRRFMYLATSQGQAERIALADFQQLIPSSWGRWSKPNGIPTLKTRFGSELLIAGIDEPTRIEGVPVDGIVWDEAHEANPKAYDKTIAPMRIDRKAKLIVLAIPRYDAPNIQVVKTLYEQGLLGIDGCKSYTWFSSDVVPKEELEKLRAGMSPQAFRVEFEASWESAPGRAYPDFNLSRNVKRCLYDNSLPLLVGCDFNRKHHTWGLYQYHDEAYWILEDLYGQGATVEIMAKMLRSRTNELQPQRIEFYGDYSGNQLKAEATNSAWLQIKAQFPDAHYGVQPQPPVSDRIEKVNSFVMNASGEVRLFCDPSARIHRRDLEEVSRVMAFAGDGGNDGELTHSSSALGYTIWQHQQSLMKSEELSEPILFF